MQQINGLVDTYRRYADELARRELFDGVGRDTQDFIAKQRLEASVLGLTAQQASALKYEFDMLNDARRAGIDLTEPERTGFRMLAKSMAEAEDYTRRLTERFTFFRDLTKGVFTDFRNDLISNMQRGMTFWESAWRSMANAAINALNRITDKILNDVVDALFQLGNPGSTGGAGLPAAILGSIGNASVGATYTAPVAAVQRAALPPLAGANDNLAQAATSQTMQGYRAAIQAMESGGRYNALGPVLTSGRYAGDRAYGAYQVMGGNIPKWSKAALGRSLTPQEFLGDRAAQDAIFDHRFGGYVDRHGPAGAASMWFTGRPHAPGARDVFGTSGAQYVERFEAALSKATVTTGSLDKAADGAINGLTGASDGLASFGQGLDKFGGNLSNWFPPAPSGGAGGVGSVFSSIFRPGGQLAIALGGGIGLYARGTESAPPGWAWVGEEGPELMRLRGGETIRSHSRSLQMVAQAPRRQAANSDQAPNAVAPQPANININVNVEGANGDQHVIDLVREGVSQGIKEFNSVLPYRMVEMGLQPNRKR